LYRISNDPTGITTTLIDSGAGGFFTALGYGAGYVFVEGFQAVISGPLAPRGLFYRIRSTPVLKTDASTFFQSTYTEHFLAWGLFPPVIYARQGQTSLVLPVYGLGDVYDLASALPATDLMVLQSAP